MAYIVETGSREVSPFLTTREAAVLLHVHVNTLRRWSNGGLLPSFRIGARGDRRFLHDDLMRFLDDCNAFKENP